MQIEINHIKWDIGWRFLAYKAGLLTEKAEQELYDFIQSNPDADVAQWASDVFYDKLKLR